MCFVKSCLSSNIAAVDSFADMVGIKKLVTARTEKTRSMVKQTKIRSSKSPLEKITRKPDSVSTKNC